MDVLTNNAGLGYYGEFDEMPFEAIQSLLEVNIASLVELTRRILSDMIEVKTGKYC